MILCKCGERKKPCEADEHRQPCELQDCLYCANQHGTVMGALAESFAPDLRLAVGVAEGNSARRTGIHKKIPASLILRIAHWQVDGQAAPVPFRLDDTWPKQLIAYDSQNVHLGRTRGEDLRASPSSRTSGPMLSYLNLGLNRVFHRPIETTSVTGHLALPRFRPFG